MPEEVRLRLAESLLVARTVAECAERALAWLRAHVGVRRALCLAARPGESGRLDTVASVGVDTARAAAFGLDLEAGDHPLARVVMRASPAVFSRNGGQRSITPLGPTAFQAVPLLGLDPSRDAPPGLLLLSPLVPDLDVVRWLARLLGSRLNEMHAREARVEAEQKLREEQALLYSIVNAVTDPILLTNTEGRILVANARAEALLASGEGQSEGRRRAVALNNMLFSAALSRRAIADAEPWRHELLLVDPSDGSDMLFELLSTVTTDPREGTGIVSILRNVSDLRRATEEIEAQYQRLRQAEVEAHAERVRLDLIIDSVADPILVTEPSGNIVMMNAPAERLFTYNHDTDSEEAQRAVQANDAHFSSFVSNLFFGDALRRSGGISLMDPRTGAPLPVEAIAGKIVSERGEVTAIVTVLHDRTEELERARLFEELKQASAQLEQKVRAATAELVHQNELLRRSHIALEQASALKSQFLANMSHEFRTPLNAILGYTNGLLRNVAGDLQVQQRRNVERIDSNAQNLLSIINDILDISRIEAGRMPLTVSDFALANLIKEVLTEVEPLIVRSKLVVDSRVAEDLPSVVSDRQKMKQILINLVTNALKFTPQGSVTVAVEHRPEDDRILVSVQDTGIGIAAQDQEAIFEDFRQADNSPSRPYTGAGLGLAICRRLTVMLDGTLGVQSRPGEGATFTLAIPRVPAGSGAARP
jgi:signal transduction histidine kinase